MGLPVLFLIQHLDIGGTEHHLLDLVAGLDGARLEPHVIHFNNREGKVARLMDAQPGVLKSFIPVSRAYAPSGWRAAWAVRRYVRRRRIAAVVTYHFVADWIGALATLGGPPLVSSRRDTGFTRTSRQIQAGRLMRGAFDRYIAVSEAVAAAVAREERVDPARIEVIYNGVDLELLARAPWDRAAERARLDIAPEEIVIGCVANFNPVKRHEDLIAAFARARDLSGGAPLRLLLAGTGPRQEEAKAAIARAGLRGAVSLVGQSADVTREILMSDIVALASETEGFSNSIVQAMALARPVVACAAGGNPEAVEDGATGLLVPPRDVEAFAAALTRLARDANLRAAMGQRGARRARARFSRRAMLEQTITLIERLVEG